MCQYQSKNMEVDIKIISSTSFLNLTFLNHSISALIQFKTFFKTSFSKMPKFKTF